MQTRKFDELISYFNRKVAEMNIDKKYKMELLGMVTALGLAHEKELTALPEQRWIPVTERLPDNSRNVLITHRGGVSMAWYNGLYFEKGASTHHQKIKTVTAWCELPEPYQKGVAE